MSKLKRMRRPRQAQQTAPPEGPPRGHHAIGENSFPEHEPRGSRRQPISGRLPLEEFERELRR